jgi:predicted nucleic acid-binding protein
MVLVDTSVWINHFKRKDIKLSGLLEEGNVVIHTFIIGELSCGKIKNRAEILALLQNLPRISILTLDEYLLFIENNKLMGKGLGFVDIHLLGSSVLTGNKLFTYDKKLAEIANSLHLKYNSN